MKEKQLFEHNQRAYEAAQRMLETSGKAAIIHPTGTGKSFIAFKLCAENTDKRVLWLSPSEYIYRTQAENYLKVMGEAPQNITFYTYAALAQTELENLRKIEAEFIVLDEFHRCGAKQWGEGVKRLLSVSRAKILGLTATNIRYLDNKRDMADELFEGNVASEMTLGEAIVKGILDPPKYIQAVYQYKKDLNKYAKRISRVKNARVRSEAEKQLEALKRALENAEGLDEIFKKQIAEDGGKYIVFCRDYKHMCEMAAKVPEWFNWCKEAPKVYRAYAEDRQTSREIRAFKEAAGSEIKLMFCIDMLNEGLHIADVKGVILFRPTVSPIVYKQQIGRALTAGKSAEPVIFDIVNNIENLYSIGALEREMQVAIDYYRRTGAGEKIINERFKLIDEVRESRELFRRLGETLTASWDMMYDCAAEYYREHKNLDVPRRYKTAEGYSLGSWLNVQRKVYNGEQYGVLTQERIEKLESIKMTWGSARDAAWAKNYASAVRYRAEFGDLKAEAKYTDKQGVKLGEWLAKLRTYRKSGIQGKYLTAERIEKLDALGMIWDVPDYLWSKNYAAAMEYYRKHGDLDVPVGYVSAEGIRLGSWIRRLRSINKGEIKGVLTEEQKARLNEVGMEWTDKYTRQWERGFKEAQKYYERHKDLAVSPTYVTESGFKLGDWLNNQRENKKISLERKARLDKIGMIWQKRDPWEIRYDLAREYYALHGNLKVPANYVVGGIWLNKWVNEQKQIYKGRRAGKRLSKEQIMRLETVGMVW